MDSIVLQLRQLGVSHSCVGFLATVLVLGIKVYKMPILQDYIPQKLRWGTLTPQWQFVVTIAFSGLAGMLTALSTGKSGWELLGAFLSAVQDAILNGTK